MSALDNLPPDQRAVLQMVLQRGRTYDEIASVLSIERGAVRQRALDAFDALAPATVIPGPESALVTDYLLGQLPDRVSEEVHTYLMAADADREWAQAVAGVVAPLAAAPLPEIPVGAPLGADDRSSGGLELGSDPFRPEPAHEPTGDDVAPLEESPRFDPLAVGSALTPSFEPVAAREPRPSSRRGGAILLGLVGVLIAAAIVVAVVTAGGSTPAHHSRGGSSSTPRTTPTGSGSTTTPTGSTTTVANTTQILAQLNLTSPTGASKTIGIAQVIRVKGVVGVAIDAQAVPANTAHNAYAVWLYNSPTSYKLAGFVQNLVGSNGRLSALGRLPAGAGAYHRLLITLETQRNPTHPGEVVLSGPFREHP